MSERDVEQLDRALEGQRDHLVPSRIVELMTLATEVAEALASPALSAVDRNRLLARVEEMAAPSNGRSRQGRLFRGWRRHPALIGAGGAALTVAAAIVVAALRVRESTKPAASAA